MEVPQRAPFKGTVVADEYGLKKDKRIWYDTGEIRESVEDLGQTFSPALEAKDNYRIHQIKYRENSRPFSMFCLNIFSIFQRSPSA